MPSKAILYITNSSNYNVSPPGHFKTKALLYNMRTRIGSGFVPGNFDDGGLVLSFG